MDKGRKNGLTNGSHSQQPGSEALCDEPVTIICGIISGHPGQDLPAGYQKTIDGKVYLFDEDGHMLSGWQTYGDNSDYYYLGTENEGFAHTGWQYLRRMGENVMMRGMGTMIPLGMVLSADRSNE